MRDRKLPSVHEYHLIGCLTGLILTVVVVSAIAAAATYAAWKSDNRHVAPAGYAGDPERGEILISAYGCTSCHSISHQGTKGLVGPPLDRMASRSYIAGRFANHQIWMTLWLQHPQKLKPGTAMPDLNVSERDALDMSAHLATLR